MREHVTPLDLRVVWEPNSPEAKLLTTDQGEAILTLNAHHDDVDQSKVVIHWSNVWSASMGYPNDEGNSDHRLYLDGLKELSWAGIVNNSRVLESLPKQQRNQNREPTHFIVVTKEVTIEVVAGSLSVIREP